MTVPKFAFDLPLVQRQFTVCMQFVFLNPLTVSRKIQRNIYIFGFR